MHESNLESYFVQKQVEVLLEINNKKIASEINTLSSSISSLKQEISDMKRYFRENMGSLKILEQNSQFSADTGIKAASTQDNVPVQRGTAPNPDNISVFRFFYAGKK